LIIAFQYIDLSYRHDLYTNPSYMQKLTNKKVLWLLAITPLFLFIEFVIGLLVFLDIQHINKEEAKNSKMDLYLRTNTKYVTNAESAQRGYLLTGDKKFLENYNANLEEIRKNEEYYDSLPGDIRERDLSALQHTSKKKFEEMSLTIQLYDAGHKDSSLAVVNTGYGKRMMDTIRATSLAIRTQISDQMAEEKKLANQLFFLFLGLIALLMVFNLFIVWYTYSKFKNYAEHIETMVSSLQNANDRMGEYTSQSYHELKTPLRSISGFAQLLRVRYADQSHGGEEADFVKYITDGIKQMNNIINEMRYKYLAPGTDREIDS
jgi:CHASE3 domain sensor protein